MTRIGFLLSAVLSLASGHVRPAQAKTIRRTGDVLVIGGTTSGTSAAIAAARQGAATLIVEPTPMLGGMFSAQGVPAADGNHHLPSGLWNEFREALRAHYGGAEALATGWVSNTLFEPQVADSIISALAAAERAPLHDFDTGAEPSARPAPDAHGKTAATVPVYEGCLPMWRTASSGRWLRPSRGSQSCTGMCSIRYTSAATA